MTDIFDMATEHEESARTDALGLQRRRAGLAGKTTADSAMECAVCDGAIPVARRTAVPGVQTCIECQDELERAARINGNRTK